MYMGTPGFDTCMEDARIPVKKSRTWLLASIVAASLGGFYGLDYSSRTPVEPEIDSFSLKYGMGVKLKNPNWMNVEIDEVHALVYYHLELISMLKLGDIIVTKSCTGGFSLTADYLSPTKELVEHCLTNTSADYSVRFLIHQRSLFTFLKVNEFYRKVTIPCSEIAEILNAEERVLAKKDPGKAVDMCSKR